jgi:hypothetical protein
MIFSKSLYGQEAVEVATALNRDREAGEYDAYTQVFYTIKYVEGRCVVDMELRIP